MSIGVTPSVFEFEFSAMGTGANAIRVAAPDGAQAKGMAQMAICEVQRIEAKYSRYRPDSIISRINVSAGEDWIECDAETLSLLDFGDSLHRASQGRFDLTSGVLRRVWDFKKPRLPKASALADLLSVIGWSLLERKGNTVRLAKRGMELDFGGIGKEYAADRAATALVQAGARHGFVNLAGDLAFVGAQPDGRAWSIGIPAPREPGKTVASIPISRGGLATSGDYERYFELNGKRYCHLLNPLTGYPVSYWQSVSVLAPSASIAGSCSTVAMLLEEQGLRFLRDSGFAFLAIDHKGRKQHYSL
jgi:FAD:protein FMN transferase